MDRLATLVFTDKTFRERKLGARIWPSTPKMDGVAALPRFGNAILSSRYIPSNALGIERRVRFPALVFQDVHKRLRLPASVGPITGVWPMATMRFESLPIVN